MYSNKDDKALIPYFTSLKREYTVSYPDYKEPTETTLKPRKTHPIKPFINPNEIDLVEITHALIDIAAKYKLFCVLDENIKNTMEYIHDAICRFECDPILTKTVIISTLENLKKKILTLPPSEQSNNFLSNILDDIELLQMQVMITAPGAKLTEQYLVNMQKDYLVSMYSGFLSLLSNIKSVNALHLTGEHVRPLVHDWQNKKFIINNNNSIQAILNSTQYNVRIAYERVINYIQTATQYKCSKSRAEQIALLITRTAFDQPPLNFWLNKGQGHRAAFVINENRTYTIYYNDKESELTLVRFYKIQNRTSFMQPQTTMFELKHKTSLKWEGDNTLPSLTNFAFECYLDQKTMQTTEAEIRNLIEPASNVLANKDLILKQANEQIRREPLYQQFNNVSPTAKPVSFLKTETLLSVWLAAASDINSPYIAALRPNQALVIKLAIGYLKQMKAQLSIFSISLRYSIDNLISQLQRPGYSPQEIISKFQAPKELAKQIDTLKNILQAFSLEKESINYNDVYYVFTSSIPNGASHVALDTITDIDVFNKLKRAALLIVIRTSLMQTALNDAAIKYIQDYIAPNVQVEQDFDIHGHANRLKMPNEKLAALFNQGYIPPRSNFYDAQLQQYFLENESNGNQLSPAAVYSSESTAIDHNTKLIIRNIFNNKQELITITRDIPWLNNWVTQLLDNLYTKGSNKKEAVDILNKYETDLKILRGFFQGNDQYSIKINEALNKLKDLSSFLAGLLTEDEFSNSIYKLFKAGFDYYPETLKDWKRNDVTVNGQRFDTNTQQDCDLFNFLLQCGLNQHVSSFVCNQVGALSLMAIIGFYKNIFQFATVKYTLKEEKKLIAINSDNHKMNITMHGAFTVQDSTTNVGRIPFTLSIQIGMPTNTNQKLTPGNVKLETVKFTYETATVSLPTQDMSLSELCKMIWPTDFNFEDFDQSSDSGFGSNRSSTKSN